MRALSSKSSCCLLLPILAITLHRAPTTGAPPHGGMCRPLPHTGERGARVLARGAHHESERAAHEQAYTEQQCGHAEDARGGWLRGQAAEPHSRRRRTGRPRRSRAVHAP